jgi:hypothetical protein
MTIITLSELDIDNNLHDPFRLIDAVAYTDSETGLPVYE